MRKRELVVGTVLGGALCLVIASQAAAGVCKQTSKDARTACRHEAADDYSIAIGTCRNIGDETEHDDCVSAAKESLAEDKDGCREQFDARQDLCKALGDTRYDPEIDPLDFLSPQATAANPNPLFPLVPGTTWHYESPSEKVTVTVTGDTRMILDVTTIVVRDTVLDQNDMLVEDTEDFFAQHVDGTVWYFGELSQSFDENGELESLDGSWRGGVDGAKPGIVMKAMPMVGDLYRQEFALGDAEDAAEVISTTGTENVPAPGASCAGTCVVTRDFTPLEPGVEENKYYKAGLGLILEIDLETGERLELTSMSP